MIILKSNKQRESCVSVIAEDDNERLNLCGIYDNWKHLKIKIDYKSPIRTNGPSSISLRIPKTEFQRFESELRSSKPGRDSVRMKEFEEYRIRHLERRLDLSAAKYGLFIVLAVVCVLAIAYLIGS